MTAIDDTRPRETAPPPDMVAAAVRAAAYSKCLSQRGAALFTTNGLIVAGFNHRPDGCDQSAACKATCRFTAIHAEQDAIMRSRRDISGAELVHAKVVNSALVASGGPSCVQCSRLVLETGIAAVWLYGVDGWRRYEAAEFHRLSIAALAASPTPGTGTPTLAGTGLIAAERYRQMAVEGWTPAHDDAHVDGELPSAAICYTEAGSGFDLEISASKSQPVPFLWPWEASWWKPSDDLIRNLVKAGALIAAEIDRLQRAGVPSPPPCQAALAAPAVTGTCGECRHWDRDIQDSSVGLCMFYGEPNEYTDRVITDGCRLGFSPRTEGR